MIGPIRLDRLDDAARDRLFRRGPSTQDSVARAVSDIIDDVRDRGDDALRDLARRFDAAEPAALEVAPAAWTEALDALDPAVREALEAAAAAIRTFHAAQLPLPVETETAPGVRVGRRPDPLRRVGVYAPGGRAAYPSSVLMGVIPARVAGVGEVVVCSPPGPDGLPSPAVMAACVVAGADRLFAIGGAGAVAAMAYGTAAVPRVDRVVGPGNAYVAEAKRQVAAVVGIDSPAGPSELLVIADDGADADAIAAEMVAQAEHDPDAAVVLMTTSEELSAGAAAALERRVVRAGRRDIVRAALAANGALLVADSLNGALRFAEEYAPEHLLLLVDEPRRVLERVRCAGTVFLGETSSVAFGDYATGANHTLPTGGLARSYSGLSVDDFVRWTSWQEVTAGGARGLAEVAAVLAGAEGLPGHAAAARRAGRAGRRRDRDFPGAPAEAPRVGAGFRQEGRSGNRRRGSPSPRRPYRDLAAYDPARGSLEVDLSANTSLWGASPAALEAAAAVRPTDYPTPWADALKRAIAERWGVEQSQVVTGCGSDDVIDSSIRAFCEPDATLAFPAPTFPMADVFARMNAVRPVPVQMDPEGRLAERGLDALIAADMVYLCRPNNPTGAMIRRELAERVLERARGVVLIDEAYGEFAGESLLDAALESGRGVVLRTMSKAHGLAGLRVGYALGPAGLVRPIELSRGPYKVGGAAGAAATAAMRDTSGWLEDVVARAVRERDRLAAALRERGLRVVPSAANFVLFTPEPGADNGWATTIRRRLAEDGIGVRAFDGLAGLGDAIRVTAGPPELMRRFLDALDRTLAERPPERGADSGRGAEMSA